MRVCIYRGSGEIGGNCVELEPDGRCAASSSTCGSM